jgi:magnesium transporter
MTTTHSTSQSRRQTLAGMTWIDLENPSRKTLAELADTYKLHPLQVEECFSKDQLPQIEVEDEYVFLLMYFPKYIAEQNSTVAAHVGIFLGKNYLITVHEEKTPVITDLFYAYEQGIDHKDAHLKKSPAFILHGIITALLVDISSMVHAITKDLDAIEVKVFDDEGSDAFAIGQLRQKIMKLRRIMYSLKDMSAEIASSIHAFSGENLMRQYGTNTKRINKLWEAIEESRETVEIYKDADFTTNTEKTNSILAVLTLLFTFTIPATVLGTFYGMNVPMPGGFQTGPWTFFGQYTTLIIIVIFSLLPIYFMMRYFRKKKWF